MILIVVYDLVRAVLITSNFIASFRADLLALVGGEAKRSRFVQNSDTKMALSNVLVSIMNISQLIKYK